MVDFRGILDEITTRSLEHFRSQKRILSFQQFLELFLKDPVLLGRSAAQYMLDCFDYYGKEEQEGIAGPVTRFKLFDAPFSGGHDKLVGHEEVQQKIYEHLRHFSATGQANRMLLLHGPNGSGKSSVLDLITRAMEDYSTTDAGCLFTFNWIFTERVEGNGHMGFGKSEIPTDTLAHVDENMISCKIPSELRENPIFLIPREEREKLLDRLIQENPNNRTLQERFKGVFLRSSTISFRSKQIYDALLNAYRGDWTKIMKHVQVERYFISQRYRRGSAVVMPQQSVDAHSRSLSFDQGPALPPVLQGLLLDRVTGELVDACGGMLEYSDLLKRPLELNKYLLSTVERQMVSLENSEVQLNLVMMGTCNEKYLSAFKATPDFTSFKGRIELIRVSYLLEWQKEREIYCDFIAEICGDKHMAPHTLDMTAMWCVMTRLNRPDPEDFPDELTGIIRNLTPLEKTRLYGERRVPVGMKTDQKRSLLAALPELRDEFTEAVAEFEQFVCAAYEGRRGASAREIKSLLADSAENRNRHCLSPLGVFDAILQLLKDRSVYDFLRLAPDEGYHDPVAFVEELRKEYFNMVTVEIYDSMELIQESEFERRVNDYFKHVRAYVSGERIQNLRTGAYENASEQDMAGLEKLIDSQEKPEIFRRNLITKVAAFSLEHPDEKLDYSEIFPDLISRLRNSYYQDKKKPLRQLGQDVLIYGTEDDGLITNENRPKIEKALAVMRTKYGYCDHCSKEVIGFVISGLPS